MENSNIFKNINILLDIYQVCMWEGVFTCVCGWVPGIDVRFLNHSPPCFLRQDISLISELTVWFKELALMHQGLACLLFDRAGVTDLCYLVVAASVNIIIITSVATAWLLGIYTQVLMTSQQAVYKTLNLGKFCSTLTGDPIWKYFKSLVRNLLIKWIRFTLKLHLQQSTAFYCNEPFFFPVKVKFAIIYIGPFVSDCLLHIFSACICCK